MTSSTGNSSSYQPLDWLGSHTDGNVEYIEHAYGPFKGHEDNLYLVRQDGDKVKAEVSHNGELVAADAKDFDLPTSASSTEVVTVVEEEACPYLEDLNGALASCGLGVFGWFNEEVNLIVSLVTESALAARSPAVAIALLGCR